MTLTVQDLDNAERDLKTVSAVSNSRDPDTSAPVDSYQTRLGDTSDTLNGRLKKLGYEPPVVYAGGISFTSNDNVKTVDESGIVYAPLPSALPFTTSGTWVGDDDARFFVVQGVYSSELPKYIAAEFATVADMIAGNSQTLGAVDFADYVGRTVSVVDGITKKYVIKTLSQASAGGDIIDGEYNVPTSDGVHCALVQVANPRPYPESGFDLFVLNGQSNTVGYAGNTDGFPDNIYNVNSYFDNSADELRPIESSITSSSGDTSSGHAWQAFANEYTRQTGRYVIIAQCALGGATIDDLKQGSTPYNQMLASVAALDAYCVANNITINNRSVLWHQGESDMSGGTLHNDYITALAALAVDMRADLNTDKFYIARVGCPQNRTEESWYAIQSAQDFICQSFDYFVMSFNGCGSFTLGNGLLRDGVHYTQHGYNAMGSAIAKSVAQSISEPSPYTDDEKEQYNALMTTPDQIWRHTFASLIFDSGAFSIQDIDGTTAFRAVNVLSSSISGGDLLVSIQSRSDYIIGMEAGINELAEKYGFRAVVDLTGTGSQTWALKVSFYKDVSFLLSLDTGSIGNPYYPTGFPVHPWLSSVSATELSSNYYRVNHPWTDSEVAPIVTPAYESSVLPADVAPVYIVPESVTNGSLRVRTTVASGGKALVTLQNCKIDASELLDDFEVYVSAIVAAKKL